MCIDRFEFQRQRASQNPQVVRVHFIAPIRFMMNAEPGPWTNDTNHFEATDEEPGTIQQRLRNTVQTTGGIRVGDSGCDAGFGSAILSPVSSLGSVRVLVRALFLDEEHERPCAMVLAGRRLRASQVVTVKGSGLPFDASPSWLPGRDVSYDDVVIVGQWPLMTMTFIRT